ncbi:MAG: type VI secretion system protein TssA [Holosporaceae bacterium]|jgi:type VI secretion system ImpA family protein|nr:type VI secretion system protein TssA [Holosporaceae bacterium]
MINIDELLQPIPGENECGAYLKYDPLYDTLKELRRADDPNLTQGIWVTNIKKANWADVIRVCTDAIISKTKDLQIAVWLAEALVCQHGFDGLDQSILLLQELCKKFWHNIYPLPADGDISSSSSMRIRLLPLYFFEEKVTDRILLIPLTHTLDSMIPARTLADWIMARHNMHIKGKNGITIQEIKKSVQQTPVDFFQNIDEKLANITVHIKSFDGFLTKLCGYDAPSFHKLYDYCDDIIAINSQNLSEMQAKIQKAENLRIEKLRAESLPDASVYEVDHHDITSDVPSNKTPTDITLEQAYDILNKIAQLLERTQPQNPVSTLIKIADNIKSKTFIELLETNIHGGMSAANVISELYNVLVRAK